MAHPTNFVPKKFEITESALTKKVEQSLAGQAELVKAFHTGKQKATSVGEKTINRAIEKEVAKAKAENPVAHPELEAFLMANYLGTEQKLRDPNTTPEERKRLQSNKQFELFFLSKCTAANAARDGALKKAEQTGFVKGMEKVAGKLERRVTQVCANPPCGESPVTSDITLKVCNQCKKVFYCSRPCQLAHWKASHKAECLPASSAATASEPSTATASQSAATATTTEK